MSVSVCSTYMSVCVCARLPPALTPRIPSWSLQTVVLIVSRRFHELPSSDLTHTLFHTSFLLLLFTNYVSFSILASYLHSHTHTLQENEIGSLTLAQRVERHMGGVFCNLPGCTTHGRVLTRGGTGRGEGERKLRALSIYTITDTLRLTVSGLSHLLIGAPAFSSLKFKQKKRVETRGMPSHWRLIQLLVFA